MAVVNPRFDQSSAGGFDDPNGLLCVQRGLKSKTGWKKTEIFAAVVDKTSATSLRHNWQLNQHKKTP